MTPVQHRPDRIATLCQATGFSKQELQLMYRSFKQECPSGLVNEGAFEKILGKIFPLGDATLYSQYLFRAFDLHSDGIINFEKLVIGVSNLSRGSLKEKLKWIFKMYDANGDGMITRQELRDVVNAVHQLSPHAFLEEMKNGTSSTKTSSAKLVRRSSRLSIKRKSSANERSPTAEDPLVQHHADKVFQKLDFDGDGIITWDDFYESCSKDEAVTSMIALLHIT